MFSHSVADRWYAQAMDSLAKLFDQRHLQTTLSWLAIAVSGIAALLVLQVVLSHVMLVVLLVAFVGLVVGAAVWLGQ